jgi:hypothetical protein
LRSLKILLKVKYQGLNVEEDHADESMSRLVKPEEIYEGILKKDLLRLARLISWYGARTTDAAKEPFNHRRRCPISSTAVSGTSVSALLGLT